MSALTPNTIGGGPGVIPGGGVAAVPSPTGQLAVLFLAFLLFGVVMATIFVSYVLPEACKRETEQHLVATPVASAAAVTPAWPQTYSYTPPPSSPVTSAVRTASASPYAQLHA
jgi:hypothetical protein